MHRASLSVLMVKVSIVDANGQPQDGGQIGIVTFANSDGLDKIGSNLYRESLNSGTASAANQPGDGGTGSLKVGFLEMSNVDLTDEFTEMIVAQRGFQSNSKLLQHLMKSFKNWLTLNVKEGGEASNRFSAVL